MFYEYIPIKEDFQQVKWNDKKSLHYFFPSIFLRLYCSHVSVTECL